jgi:serine/threonine protein kinase
VEDRAGPIPVGKPRPRSPTKDGELAGRTLGDFVVAEKIGEGGFGAVYRAHQPLLDRPAVIKVLHTRLRATGAATERFLREARLASRLDHPYAAHIYAFGAEPDGTLWIAMELVRGVRRSPSTCASTGRSRSKSWCHCSSASARSSTPRTSKASSIAI